MADTTGIDHLVCFELYAASRALTGLYRPTLDAHGLTYPQFLALRVVWHHGTITVRNLGHTLDLDSGTLSPLLKRLEHQGLVHRERGTHDERTVWIQPTAKSLELRPQLADLVERVACAVELTHDELTHLHHLLSRLRASATTATI